VFVFPMSMQSSTVPTLVARAKIESDIQDR
jgi:hypothetical protein